MSNHRWNGNRCVRCELKRKSDFKKTSFGMEGRPIYAYPGEKVWTRQMPDCVDVRVVDKEFIIKSVSDYFGVNIFEKRKKWEIVLPRQIAIALLHTFAPMTYSDIGELFSSDHTTMIWAKRKVWDLCATDPAIRKVVIELETMIE